MEKLLSFILENIIGSKNFDIEVIEEGEHVNLEVKVGTDDIGLVIGKGGNTIKAVTQILRVKGTIEDKLVNINVSEK